MDLFPSEAEIRAPLLAFLQDVLGPCGYTDPPTPMTETNLAWHFLFGFRSSMVESVMVAGKWIVKDRNVVGIDVPSEYRKAAKVTNMLWDRMENL